MLVGDHVITKAAFWTGPSLAREKTVYRIVNVIDLSSGGEDFVPRFDLRARRGPDLNGVPENYFELVAVPIALT